MFSLSILSKVSVKIRHLSLDYHTTASQDVDMSYLRKLNRIARGIELQLTRFMATVATIQQYDVEAPTFDFPCHGTYTQVIGSLSTVQCHDRVQVGNILLELLECIQRCIKIHLGYSPGYQHFYALSNAGINQNLLEDFIELICFEQYDHYAGEIPGSVSDFHACVMFEEMCAILAPIFLRILTPEPFHAGREFKQLES
jgi:hypothetical protein